MVEEVLSPEPGNVSCTGAVASMTITWGDGSGTRNGGTSERVEKERMEENGRVVETWMGTWAPHVAHFDSNWRELRTLLL
jgi:hypothetical protein